MIEKISVIVPVLNGEKTIGACIESLLCQSYPNYEVIIVNNNSCDDTQKIIDSYLGDPRLKTVTENRLGGGKTRNTGISLATGEILAMTDADCVALPDWLAKLCEPILAGSESVTMGSESNINNNYWSNCIQRADLAYFEKCRDGKYINTLDNKNFAIKAALIKGVLYDDNISYLEDYDLYLRLRPFAAVRWVPEAIVGHFHKTKFSEVVRVGFRRGFITAKIFLKLRHKVINRQEAMLKNFSIINFILFPVWVMANFLTKPWKDAVFLAINDTSWRSGMICGLLEKSRLAK